MIRVGYLSRALSSRGAGKWVQDLFHSHAQRGRVHAYALSLSAPSEADAVTMKIRKEAAEWVDLSALATDERCARINAEQLHVVVLLDAWGEGRGMRLLARRVAPVQVHT